MALGLLTWTIVEYGVHRFVLHSVEGVARLHEQHHATPGAYVGTPTWMSLLSFALAIEKCHRGADGTSIMRARQ
jgi:sterol desaturase/sphingolipid hydroxylase (fatty acid hydroxylase superfamily)